MPESTPSAKLTSEFVGTFLLVLTVGCNVLSGNVVWGGVSIACVLMVSIYAFGGISGANFNPAVSVALTMCDKMDPTTCMQYSLVQIAGGFVASACYFALFGKTFQLMPAAGFGWVSAALCETLYTFMLCFVVLNVACTSKNGKCPNEYYGLAIGFVIVAGAYGAGAVSGGCFNPAVAIAIDTSSFTQGFGWCIAYTLFEIVGAAMAAGCYKVVHPEEVGDAPEEVSTASKLVAEFLGTFMLVLTVGLNVLGKSPAGAFSIAASLMCMIYALGDVSGANFNPAVTFAIYCSGRAEGLLATAGGVGMYMVTQIAAGVFAAGTYATIHKGGSFALGAQKDFGWMELGIAEAAFTFVLCFVVLCSAVAKETKSEQMFGLAIGSCVTVGGFAIGGISGGSLNPAVSVGIAAAQTLNGGFFYKAIVYSFFEILGAVVAAAVFRLTHAAGDPQAGKKEKEEDPAVTA